jgi:hypothetical protein
VRPEETLASNPPLAEPIESPAEQPEGCIGVLLGVNRQREGSDGPSFWDSLDAPSRRLHAKFRQNFWNTPAVNV